MLVTVFSALLEFMLLLLLLLWRHDVTEPGILIGTRKTEVTRTQYSKATQIPGFCRPQSASGHKVSEIAGK